MDDKERIARALDPRNWDSFYDDFRDDSWEHKQRRASLEQADAVLAVLDGRLLPEGFDPDYMESERGEEGQSVTIWGPPYEPTSGVSTESQGTGTTIAAAIRAAVGEGDDE